jgi:singapore isolate B (sub-type 7) whole genome shotgun sequence assembly, scaffold_20
MEQLIERIHPQSVFDKKRGWISSEDMMKLRNLLKKQAVILLDSCGYDTDAVRISEFCDIDFVWSYKETNQQ